MPFYRCNSGGGGLFQLLKNLPASARTTAAAATEIAATIGKHYLLIATQIATDTATAAESITGANIEWETTVVKSGNSNSRAAYTKVYLVTATASAISVTIRSGNINKGYTAIQLD